MASKAVLDIKPPPAPQAQYIFTRIEKKILYYVNQLFDNAVLLLK